MPSPFPHRHLLGIEGLSGSDLIALLDAAEPWIAFNRGPRKADARLAGLTQINAFFENSTRTLFSFEIAGKRLGAQVSSFHPAASSVRKGESLRDTALTLNAMRPDILVIRHEAEGAAADVAAIMDCPVINAGDGAGEHPTQALLDALTMRRRFGRIEGLKVAICGDIVHSRVAGSNIRALPLLARKVRCRTRDPAASDTGMPLSPASEGIAGADVVMMCGSSASGRRAFRTGSISRNYGPPRGLDAHGRARSSCPGAENRGVDIDGACRRSRPARRYSSRGELGGGQMDVDLMTQDDALNRKGRRIMAITALRGDPRSLGEKLRRAWRGWCTGAQR